MWSRRIVWLALFILSLLGISFYGGALSYGLLCGVALVPLVSLCYLILLYFRFKVYQNIDSRNVVCGQPVPYYFVLQNDDIFSFAGVGVRMFSDFSTVADMPEDTEYELLPGESFRYDTQLTCKYRGEYAVGVKECVVTDFFRLFSLTYRVDGKVEAIVLPKIVKLEQLKSVGQLNALLQREVMYPPVNVDITTRDYTSGDPLRQIHWKATARQQKLMVRERAGEEKQGIAILMETKRYGGRPEEYLPLENKMLELALALSLFFAKKRISLSLYYGQGDVKKERIDSLEEFDGFYHRTPQLLFAEKEEMTHTISRTLGETVHNRIVFMIVHEMKESYLAFRQQLAANGTALFFYVVTDQAPKAYQQLDDCSGILFAVGTDDDLGEVL